MENLIASDSKKLLAAAIVLSILSITLPGCFEGDGNSSNSGRAASPQTMDSGTLSLDHTSGKSFGVGLLRDRFWIDIDLPGGIYTYQHVINYPYESNGTVSYSYMKTDDVEGELLLSFSGGDLNGVSEMLHLIWTYSSGGESWSLSADLGRGNFRYY